MRVFTRRQYYVKEDTYQGKSIGWRVCRDGRIISTLRSVTEAEVHAERLNKQFGDLEAYQLLNALRDEITLCEDKEYSAATILESIKAMLDSR